MILGASLFYNIVGIANGQEPAFKSEDGTSARLKKVSFLLIVKFR